MDKSSELFESTDGYKIFHIKDIPTLMCLEESLGGAEEVIDMTSLSALLLLNESHSKTESSIGNSSQLGYLSLAYERLHSMPKILLQELASRISILDISYNEFDNLDFLAEFINLTTLVCDHNNITSNTIIPFLPKVELLWLNHCKIKELYPWANILHQSCPNLKYLSVMGNQAAPSYLNGGNFYDYLQYRLYIISLFTELVHLDDRIVSTDERMEAYCLYKKPLLERISLKSAPNLPECLRSFRNTLSNWFSSAPSFTLSNNRNRII